MCGPRCRPISTLSSSRKNSFASTDSWPSRVRSRMYSRSIPDSAASTVNTTPDGSCDPCSSPVRNSSPMPPAFSCSASAASSMPRPSRLCSCTTIVTAAPDARISRARATALSSSGRVVAREEISDTPVQTHPLPSWARPTCRPSWTPGTPVLLRPPGTSTWPPCGPSTATPSASTWSPTIPARRSSGAACVATPTGGSFPLVSWNRCGPGPTCPCGRKRCGGCCITLRPARRDPRPRYRRPRPAEQDRHRHRQGRDHPPGQLEHPHRPPAPPDNRRTDQGTTVPRQPPAPSADRHPRPRPRHRPGTLVLPAGRRMLHHDHRLDPPPAAPHPDPGTERRQLPVTRAAKDHRVPPTAHPDRALPRTQHRDGQGLVRKHLTGRSASTRKPSAAPPPTVFPALLHARLPSVTASASAARSRRT